MGTRRTIARVVGLAVATAVVVAYAIAFAGLRRQAAADGYGTRFWAVVVFIALVLGSTARSITQWFLDRRAKRRHDARIPRAVVRDRR
ncbi:MAG: hypothetical protein KF773_34190 [Deltaproteobacteria bacterium]|nr:hypothetical protein [Deltaproteobacteria bacterium]MCW5801201.1 hypothetical protein [Deltaproteobacteria bacterium]